MSDYFYSKAINHYPPFTIFSPQSHSYSKADLPIHLRQALLSAFQSSATSPAAISGNQVVKSIRSVSSVQIPEPLNSQVSEFLTSIINSKQYIPYKLIPLSSYSFLSYSAESSDHYVWHSDNGHLNPDGQFNFNYPKRVVSAVYYLNQDFIGGGIEFHSPLLPPDRTNLIQPAEDHLLLFGSDTRFLHKVNPIIQGKRFVVVNWFGVAT